jgi:hypothetical protein
MPPASIDTVVAAAAFMSLDGGIEDQQNQAGEHNN